MAEKSLKQLIVAREVQRKKTQKMQIQLKVEKKNLKTMIAAVRDAKKKIVGPGRGKKKVVKVAPKKKPAIKATAPVSAPVENASDGMGGK